MRLGRCVTNFAERRRPARGMLMRRRAFLTLLSGAAASPLLWPAVTRAQSVRRVGVLLIGTATDVVTQSYAAAFIQSLQQLGWVEGQNLRIDVRWSAADPALAKIYAAQLIGLQPDVILAASTNNLEVVRQGTRAIPIVFVQVSDPIEQGFVTSMTKPGGNITGFSAYE